MVHHEGSGLDQHLYPENKPTFSFQPPPDPDPAAASSERNSRWGNVSVTLRRFTRTLLGERLNWKAHSGSDDNMDPSPLPALLLLVVPLLLATCRCSRPVRYRLLMYTCAALLADKSGRDTQPTQPARSSDTEAGTGTPSWVGHAGLINSSGTLMFTLPPWRAAERTRSEAFMSCSSTMMYALTVVENPMSVGSVIAETRSTESASPAVHNNNNKG